MLQKDIIHSLNVEEQIKALEKSMLEKQNSLKQNELALSLSMYSTTQLKAELRRRRKEGGKRCAT